MKQLRMRWAWQLPSHHLKSVLWPRNSVQVCSTTGELVGKKRGGVSVKSGWSWSEHLQMPVSFFAVPAALSNSLCWGARWSHYTFLAFWVCVGEFITEQPSQFFFLFVKELSNFQEPLTDQESNRKEWIRHIFFYKILWIWVRASVMR